MTYDWLPHVEWILLFSEVGVSSIGLFYYHHMRDKELELRFLTRDDFRRVEEKLDTVLSIAAYVSADKHARQPAQVAQVKPIAPLSDDKT